MQSRILAKTGAILNALRHVKIPNLRAGEPQPDRKEKTNFNRGYRG
jgi:hypothetical protein